MAVGCLALTLPSLPRPRSIFRVLLPQPVQATAEIVLLVVVQVGNPAPTAVVAVVVAVVGGGGGAVVALAVVARVVVEVVVLPTDSQNHLDMHTAKK